VAMPMVVAFWWFRGPHTTVRLSNCLTGGGGILVIIGILFYAGARMPSRDGTYGLVSSVNDMNLADREKQKADYNFKSYLDSAIFYTAGAIAIAIGILVHLVGP
jgi:hypothetical protein